MLVLSRKVGEEIIIGDNIRLVVNRVSGNRVTIGIAAPDDVHIVRGELRALVHQFEEPPLAENLVSAM
jgi:carbon storage regulator